MFRRWHQLTGGDPGLTIGLDRYEAAAAARKGDRPQMAIELSSALRCRCAGAHHVAAPTYPRPVSSSANSIVRLVALSLVIVLTAAACSASDEPEVTVGPLEAATIAELDAGVAPAAQALLDASELRITAVYFGVANPEQATRFDWLEYRAEGDFFLVYNQRDPRRIEAFIRVGQEMYSAVTTDQGDEPWSAMGTQSEPPVEFFDLLAILNTMGDQPSTLVGGDTAAGRITRQQDSDSNVLWTFRKDGSEANVIELGAQWLINGDGVLQFYRVGSDVEPIAGSSGIVYEFGIADDLEPLEPPVLGAPLDLEARGIPSELIDMGE